MELFCFASIVSSTVKNILLFFRVGVPTLEDKLRSTREFDYDGNRPSCSVPCDGCLKLGTKRLNNWGQLFYTAVNGCERSHFDSRAN